MTQRYHFNIAGENGRLGLCAAVHASSEAAAVSLLQDVIVAANGTAFECRKVTPEGGRQVEYVRFYTNGLTVSAADIDDVDPDDGA